MQFVKMKKGKQILLNVGLVAAAIALILVLLPHDDKTSYTYELNQPWRYQLLTADYDTPIMRDSASPHRLRDSIHRAFVPFVKRNAALSEENVKRFRKAVAEKMTAGKAQVLSHAISVTYDRGIIDPAVYKQVHDNGKGALRVMDVENGANTVETIDARDMLTPAMAYNLIDSLYRTSVSGVSAGEALDQEVAQMVGAVIVPNVVIDSAANEKFHQQEYLLVNGAMGMIKKGQRIVDRGEIVTPQIYTNLNTYLDILERKNVDDNKDTYFMVGQALYILICFAALYFYLYTFRPRFLKRSGNMVFLITFITAFVAISILAFEYIANGIYLVPIAAIPVVLMVFFDSRTAIFSLVITVVISALVAVYPFQFIFIELAAGLTAAFSINTLERRSQLLRTAALSFLAYVVSFVVTDLITDGSLTPFQWGVIGEFAINSVVLSFAYFLILIVERMTGFTSTVTLVELSDINNPLLRRLAEEAPGTFQHSMQVSTLAAEAARAIGGNTQLVRTGALYHDIGKLDGPMFFTENQHGINPHTGLNPETSAHKIISHVTSGMEIAHQNKLPEVIKQFITQHHGKSVTRYFYNTAVNESPDGNVDRNAFTYPGPNPQTREPAILMMADSVEAASRSLSEYTSEAIGNLVDRIIDTQEKEGLFNESPISFRDIQIVKDTFKKRLSTIYHSRVVYPELKKPEAT